MIGLMADGMLMLPQSAPMAAGHSGPHRSWGDIFTHFPLGCLSPESRVLTHNVTV